MFKLNFQPSRHGFHFKNNFTNNFGPITTKGLCGGMALACYNYYRQGYPIPTHKGDSFGTEEMVPPEHSRLRDYIYGQQINSFASAGGFFFPHFGTDNEMLRDQYRASVGDFDRIKRVINRNRLILLGLRSSRRGNLTGHQVLAYGYDESPPRVWIYDSNYPDEEMYVEADPATERIIHKHADGKPSANAGSYASFFVQLELDGASRPPYFDLGVKSGLNFSAPVGDGLRQVGERLEVEAVVRNFGDYAVRVQALGIWARDPRGLNRDRDFGYYAPPSETTTIRPNQEVRLRRIIDRFGEEPGIYRFGVSYLSEQNHWIGVPALGASAVAEASVEVVPGADAGRHYGTGGYAGPGTYFIRARHSGKVLDVSIDWFRGHDNGQPIYQHDHTNGDNQKFIVEPLPDGYVRICPKHSRSSNRCMDVAGASTDNGAAIHQWGWHGGHNQQFTIEPVGDHYRIRARHSKKCLDIAGISLDNRARLIQWDWWGGNNQLFQFVPTS